MRAARNKTSEDQRTSELKNVSKIWNMESSEAFTTTMRKQTKDIVVLPRKTVLCRRSSLRKRFNGVVALTNLGDLFVTTTPNDITVGGLSFFATTKKEIVNSLIIMDILISDKITSRDCFLDQV